MKLTRRKFLGITSLAVATAAAPPLFLKRESMTGLADLLRLRMRPLELPEEIVTPFLEDFVHDYRGTHWVKKYRFTGLNRLRMRFFDDDGDVVGDPGMVHPVEKLVTHFVMSTNILLDPKVAAGQKPIKYLGYWTHQDHCANPFAEFDLD